jgi:hypothetical protein
MIGFRKHDRLSATEGLDLGQITRFQTPAALSLGTVDLHQRQRPLLIGMLLHREETTAMRTNQQQIVGRFLFDDRALPRNAGPHPKSVTARQPHDAVTTVTWLLAIAVTAVAVRWLGL